MPVDIGAIYNQQSNIDMLVDQMMRVEAQPHNKLLDKQVALNERRKVLSDLDSKLSKFNSIAERFNDPITNYFATKLATTSDSEKFTVSAGSEAELGNHALTVERLAVSDTRVSQQYTDTDTSFTAINTDQTFSIELGHPIDGDDYNRVDIDVTVTSDVFAMDNDEALNQIAIAINDAMATATTNETIESDEVVHATVVTEESGKSRLVLRTEKSGYANRMDFTDSADNLLQTLEVNGASQSAGTAGGYITLVGNNPSESLLNSKFEMDGLTFYRDSNNVTDALDGISIQLLSTFATDQTITVNTDTESVKTEIQDFLDKYNDVITFLRDNTQIDPDTYKRGPLSDDVTYKSIMNEIREEMRSQVSGVTNSDFSTLYHIGIEADDWGLLSFEDASKLTGALEANTVYVSDIFQANDGISVRIEEYVETFVKTGGIISKGKTNLDDQLINLTDRIERSDEILYKREIQLRNEFATLQAAMARVSNQQSFFGIYGG